MKLLIIFAFVLSFSEARTLLEDEESSSEEVGTVFHDSDISCEVQGTGLKVCKECDKRQDSLCKRKPSPGCQCVDLSLKNEGEFFSNQERLFPKKNMPHLINTKNYLSKTKLNLLFLAWQESPNLKKLK